MQALLDSGIASRRGIMTAHRETVYKEAYNGLRLPVSEDLQDRSIILPLYVPMTDVEINYIIETVSNLVRPHPMHLNEEPHKANHFIR
jgi:dTDP-4-amino-4,6-dideoxygalactose transaminase